MQLSRRQFVTGLWAGSSLPWLNSCQQKNEAGGGASQGTIAVLFDGLYSPGRVVGQPPQPPDA